MKSQKSAAVVFLGLKAEAECEAPKAEEKPAPPVKATLDLVKQ